VGWGTAGAGGERRERVQRPESALAPLRPRVGDRRRYRHHQVAVGTGRHSRVPRDRSHPSRAGGLVRLPIDNRYLPPLLITLILVVAHTSFGILEDYTRTAAAIVAALGAEMLLGRITWGRWPHPASAYISGISVGILVRSPFVWPYVFASVISILTKYVLRLDNRHLWNPSNFGVSALLFLAPDTVTLLSIQWGNNIWPMAVIWMLGFVIVWRVGKLHVSAAYVVAFVVFAFVRSGLTGVP